MRTANRTIALAVAVTALVFGSAGSALAASPQMRPMQTAPGTPTACNALASAVAQLQQTRQQVVASMNTLQQRLAGTGLTARQRALARAQLALLGVGLRLVDGMVSRLQARQAQVCGGSSPPPPPPPPPPEEEGE